MVGDEQVALVEGRGTTQRKLDELLRALPGADQSLMMLEGSVEEQAPGVGSPRQRDRAQVPGATGITNGPPASPTVEAVAAGALSQTQSQADQPHREQEYRHHPKHVEGEPEPCKQ